MTVRLTKLVCEGDWKKSTLHSYSPPDCGDVLLMVRVAEWWLTVSCKPFLCECLCVGCLGKYFWKCCWLCFPPALAVWRCLLPLPLPSWLSRKKYKRKVSNLWQNCHLMYKYTSFYIISNRLIWLMKICSKVRYSQKLW